MTARSGEKADYSSMSCCIFAIALRVACNAGKSEVLMWLLYAWILPSMLFVFDNLRDVESSAEMW